MTQNITEQAVALHRNGKLGEAARLYRDALARDPRNFTARHFLGMALAQDGQPAAGLAEIETALLLRPTDSQAYLNRANILRMLGRRQDALDSLNRALAARPGWAEVLNSRGGVLLEMGRAPEALAAFDEALALTPGDPAALNNRGNALRALGRLDAALESHDRALARKPDYAEAHSNRAGLLQRLERFGEALHGFETAMALDPNNPGAFDGAAMAALNLCDFPRAASFAAQMPARVAAGQVQPRTLLGYSGDAALQRHCAAMLVAARFPNLPAPLAGRYQHGKLRIGYLAQDFSDPVTAHIAEVIARHDRAGFEILGFSAGKNDIAFGHFHDVTAMPPDAVAQAVRELEIDILVDLNGHAGEGGNLAVLAHRPAPVQASWLGYPGTTGAPFMDICIADAVAAPDRRAFSERLEYLPHSFMPRDTRRPIGPAPSRADAGLPDTGFVFASFTPAWKLNAPLFGAWVRLLQRTPDSVLWLRDPGPAKDNLLTAVKNANLDTARMIFAAGATPPDALVLADLFLDTMPCNAAAGDALSAGVPVVTARGATFAGRVAASLLTALGLPELIADNPPAYEALALELARDPARLKAIREKLAANAKTSPLFDTARFTRDLEALYRRIAVTSRP
jgi:predicted O-linked N-acetylglucosamine transferase (SPINDLY family)